jgi:hypothetical protein
VRSPGATAARAAEKLRLCALQCLQGLALAHPSVFTSPVGWLLLPSDRTSALSPRPFAGASLITLILFDPSAKVPPRVTHTRPFPGLSSDPLCVCLWYGVVCRFVWRLPPL